MTRQAFIAATNAAQIARYMPGNYRVVGLALDYGPTTNARAGLLIEGEDNAGWTLDGYVLPRLASGLYFGCEVSGYDVVPG